MRAATSWYGGWPGPHAAELVRATRTILPPRASGVIILVIKQSEPVGGIQHRQRICTFRPGAKGGYTVRCAAFPELITNGRTLKRRARPHAKRWSFALKFIGMKDGPSRNRTPIHVR